MGWFINLNKNTVKVSDECFAEICKSDTDIADSMADDGGAKYVEGNGYIWTDENIKEAAEIWLDDGELYFDCDHMEHMDYVWQIQDILKKHKVKGDIAFSSDDGDNAGDAWCYRFDGKGGMEKMCESISSLWDKE